MTTKRIERRARKLGWDVKKKNLFIDSLGNAVDRVVAETFKVSIAFVFACRQDLGIERFQKDPHEKLRKKLKRKLKKRASKLKKSVSSWDGQPVSQTFLPDALIARLGTIPDAHLAREFGVGATTVSRARRRKGIPNNKSSVHSSVLVTVREMILDSRLLDTEIARELGISTNVVFTQRRKMGLEPLDRRSIQDPEQIALLGTASDAELGRRWGVRSEAVRAARHREGIPAFVPLGWKRVGSHGKFTEPKK